MNQLVLLERARSNADRAAVRASAQERLSRARGNYERETSDRNYIVMLEAQRAWDRLRIEELVEDNKGWRRLFQKITGNVRAAMRDQELSGD